MSGRNTLDDELEHLRGDTGDDDAGRERLRELDRPRDGVGVGGVEASCADCGSVESTLAQRRARCSGPSASVPEPDFDEGKPKPHELVERVSER